MGQTCLQVYAAAFIPSHIQLRVRFAQLLVGIENEAAITANHRQPFTERVDKDRGNTVTQVRKVHLTGVVCEGLPRMLAIR